MRSKTLGLGITLLAAAVIWAFAGNSPQAFHTGAVAECSGCHSMHGAPPSGSFLLKFTDPSSTCLDCHEASPGSYHISTPEASLSPGVPPTQLTPGGDFAWLKKTYVFSLHGDVTELGQTHGHNIVAGDYNYLADSDNTLSPGGSFPASQLACTSCHDPHSSVRRIDTGAWVRAGTPGYSYAPIVASGSYSNGFDPAPGQAVGVYRILRSLGDDTQGVTFVDVPIASVPTSYNRSEATTQTRTAYGSSGSNTWGNWCGTCHDNMGTGSNVHPVDYALGSLANIYNVYVKTGDLSGSAATAFTSLVPFAEKSASYATLRAHGQSDDSYLNGPAQTDEVMCLSCHRAHASGFMYSLRWNVESEFLTSADGTYTSDIKSGQGRTEAEMVAAYGGRPSTVFSANQRLLCNKCHAKD